MKKINHAERVRREDVGDHDFFLALLEQAAGSKEAEQCWSECVDKLIALGVSEHDAWHVMADYATAKEENGFNAGFDKGFAEGALLGTYGKAAPVKKTESRPVEGN